MRHDPLISEYAQVGQLASASNNVAYKLLAAPMLQGLQTTEQLDRKKVEDRKWSYIWGWTYTLTILVQSSIGGPPQG